MAALRHLPTLRLPQKLTAACSGAYKTFIVEDPRPHRRGDLIVGRNELQIHREGIVTRVCGGNDVASMARDVSRPIEWIVDMMITPEGELFVITHPQPHERGGTGESLSLQWLDPDTLATRASALLTADTRFTHVIRPGRLCLAQPIVWHQQRQKGMADFRRVPPYNLLVFAYTHATQEQEGVNHDSVLTCLVPATPWRFFAGMLDDVRFMPCRDEGVALVGVLSTLHFDAHFLLRVALPPIVIDALKPDATPVTQAALDVATGLNVGFHQLRTEVLFYEPRTEEEKLPICLWRILAVDRDPSSPGGMNDDSAEALVTDPALAWRRCVSGRRVLNVEPRLHARDVVRLQLHTLHDDDTGVDAHAGPLTFEESMQRNRAAPGARMTHDVGTVRAAGFPIRHASDVASPVAWLPHLGIALLDTCPHRDRRRDQHPSTCLAALLVDPSPWSRGFHAWAPPSFRATVRTLLGLNLRAARRASDPMAGEDMLDMREGGWVALPAELMESVVGQTWAACLMPTMSGKRGLLEDESEQGGGGWCSIA